MTGATSKRNGSKKGKPPSSSNSQSLSASSACCYCGGSRDLGKLELFCTVCNKWFHGACLRQLKNFYGLPFMVCYTFHCADCSPTKEETWVPKQANFSHMCITALANMTWKREEEGKSGPFSLMNDIIPYFNDNWENLTSMPRRVKNTWHQTLQRTMLKETELFVTHSKGESPNDDMTFSLVETDLNSIGPNNEAVKQVGRKAGSDRASDKPEVDPTEGPKTRGASKRKATESQSQTTKRQKNTNDYTSTKFSGYAFPVDHPFNRDGYRYFLVEPDIHAPNRKEFDELEETAGKPIPAYMYRMVRPIRVELSSHDRAPQLKLSDDRMAVTGSEGYSIVRATHGVSKGKWFYEVEFTAQPPNSHVRIGWSQALAVLQACTGYDKFSYAWRSRKGTRFHDSIGKHYADGGFGQGDVLGCLIDLPLPVTTVSSTRYLPASHKALPLIKFKNHYYYEEKDEVTKATKTLKPLVGSRMEFYRNGKSFGTAFADVYEGTYYPAISLYKNASVRCNFGPTFKYPPTESDVRPMIEKSEEMLIEQTMADMLFFLENEGQLKLG